MAILALAALSASTPRIDDMIAHYDTDGVISEIEIIRSDHCGTLYGDDIRGMLRPGVTPPPTWRDS